MSEENIENERPSKESITYTTLLSAFQVILDCSLELKDTIYDQGKCKEKVREAINALTLQNAKNRNHIWKADERKAADITFAIHQIGKQIAKGDGIALHAITKLTRDGLDFSRLHIKEMTDEEIEEFKKIREAEID